MSVVLDAVNSFFGPTPSHHQYPFAQHEPPRHDQHPPPTKRSHTPPRSDTPMSAPEQRPGSSAAATTTSQHNDQACDAPAPQMTSQQSASQPSSSPLAARPAPSSGGSQAVPQASSAPDTPAARPQRSRPVKIKVRDLEHIQSFASEDMGAFSENGSRSRSNAGGEESPQYEISEMKVEHIIEMVAGLLTKITTTNDQQHEHVHRQPPQTDGGPHLDPQTTSVLAFHGKNVPSITILSYLSRINKYCPTSYEVFLSLLVYFDRMTERVNARPMQSLRQANEAAMSSSSASSDSLSSEQMEDVRNSLPDNEQMVTPPSSGSMDKPTTAQGTPGTPYSRPAQPDSPAIPPELGTIDPYNLSQFFVVDSFNIHRLVIAGVTCASKFFSDIFYTNSRYAKVGGLPLPELNHLELQFLLLNDFRLSVPVEEIEAYGTMLVEFYAREVVAQQKAAQAAEAAAMQVRSLSESSSDSTSTVRAAM